MGFRPSVAQILALYHLITVMFNIFWAYSFNWLTSKNVVLNI